MYSADLLKKIVVHIGVWFRKPSSFIVADDTIIEVQRMLDVYEFYFLAMQEARRYRDRTQQYF